MTTVRKAELIGTLDEKYVANSVTFAAMHAAGTLIVGGTDLRGADGALDRASIRRRIDRLTWFAPAMRQRLVATPLRMTTPAWAPVDELDLEYHVRFHDGIEPDDPDRVELLTGRLSPTMDLSRPLWDFLFVELDSGGWRSSSVTTMSSATRFTVCGSATSSPPPSRPTSRPSPAPRSAKSWVILHEAGST